MKSKCPVFPLLQHVIDARPQGTRWKVIYTALVYIGVSCTKPMVTYVSSFWSYSISILFCSLCIVLLAGFNCHMVCEEPYVLCFFVLSWWWALNIDNGIEIFSKSKILTSFSLFSLVAFLQDCTGLGTHWLTRYCMNTSSFIQHTFDFFLFCPQYDLTIVFLLFFMQDLQFRFTECQNEKHLTILYVHVDKFHNILFSEPIFCACKS